MIPISTISPELAINPLGDRIVHAFFRDSAQKSDGGANDETDGIDERVNFPDFVRVLAHFRPLKKNVEKNKLNGREEKLRCECVYVVRQGNVHIRWCHMRGPQKSVAECKHGKGCNEQNTVSTLCTERRSVLLVANTCTREVSETDLKCGCTVAVVEILKKLFHKVFSSIGRFTVYAQNMCPPQE